MQCRFGWGPIERKLLKLFTYTDDLEAKDLGLAWEAAKVFEFVIELVNFYILEFIYLVHCPDCAADVVLT